MRLDYRSALLTLALLAVAASAHAQNNDFCPEATAIRSVPFDKTQDTTTASGTPDEPEPSCGSGQKSVWFAYTPRSPVSLDLDTAGSDYAPTISVYTGTCGALTEIACNANTPNGDNARLILPLVGGQTVWIAVSDNHGGALHLTGTKSTPRFRNPKPLTEVVHGSDPSAYGGSVGFVQAATAVDKKTVAWVGSTGGVFVDDAGVLTTVATSGSPTPAGGTFALIGTVVVGGSDVFFTAEISGGPVADGIFVYRNGVLSPYVLPGDAAPGGGTYQSFGSHLANGHGSAILFLARTSLDTHDRLIKFDGTTATVFATEGDPNPCGGAIRTIATRFDLNASGTLAVFNGSNPSQNVLASNGTSLTALACDDAATPIGGAHSAIGDRFAVNDLGEAYFVTRVAFPGPDDVVIWRALGGSLTVVARTGTALATGELVNDIGLNGELATNPSGDVVFTSTLTNPTTRRSILRRAHLAAQPERVVLDDAPCPAGGLFRTIDDELELSAAGVVGFRALCGGGRGVFRKPLAGPPETIALLTTTTAIGSGFVFNTPRFDDATGRVAFEGSRASIESVACANPAKGCGTPLGLAVAGMTIPGSPGEILDTFTLDSLAGAGGTVGFFATTTGTQNRNVLLRARDGALDLVAAEGQLLPGDLGTLTGIETSDFTGQSTATAVGPDLVAFLASLDNPNAPLGIFAATSDGIVPVSRYGDPAPTGGIFDDFSQPTVAGKSIVFIGETFVEADETSRACVFGVRAPGKPVVAAACAGDAIPAPVGGVIEQFIGLPTGNVRNHFVQVSIDDGTRVECLLHYKNGKVRVVACLDDPYVFGQFFSDLIGSNHYGPVTDPGVQHVAFVTYDNQTGRRGLVATSGSAFIPVVQSLKTPAPVSGGVIDYGTGGRPSLVGKQVVFAAEIFGGSELSAVFRATLP